MTSADDGFEAAVRAHDAAVAARGLAIWVGAEPTFTDAGSEAPQWLWAADGGDKRARAARLGADLAGDAGVVLCPVGRQYGGEPRPRWSFGLYRRRDDGWRWRGPPDPLQGGERGGDVPAFRAALAEILAAEGFGVAVLDVEGPLGWRLAARRDGTPPAVEPRVDPRLDRAPLHRGPLPEAGLVDPLAAEGVWLLCAGWEADPDGADGEPVPWLELPAVATVAGFLALLDAVAAAANRTALGCLRLGGHPPPIDADVAWTTITPDPAVIEVNAAPAPDLARFLADARRLHAAAGRVALAPWRLHYNGQVADSGGGGQITLGGPSPEDSPFLVAPPLLPAVVRYHNRHPALSYWFAQESIGAYSQSPRPDEGPPGTLAELALTLHRLEREPALAPAVLWESLSSFLADPSGNTHRAELNVEKLWNPHLPGRGCLGLVEFRAQRMAPSPEHAAARAALLRAITAMLAQAPQRAGALRDWGRRLHDRYALPFHLREDLRAVLADLDAAGLGLGAPLVRRLLDDGHRHLAAVTHGGCVIELRRAVEFWPLLGDVASQERGSSRLVDASTVRVEVCVRPADGDPAALDGLRLAVAGWEAPLPLERDADGPARVAGLRYRAYAPSRGLHPTLPAQGPVTLHLLRAGEAGALALTLHEWRPDGGAYDGLPADFEEAARRRAERVVAAPCDAAAVPAPRPPPAQAVTGHCLDLRWR